MLNFENRTGPDLGADAPRYPATTVPAWYRDAKLGFFIHWGIYSVPAWATPPGDVPVPTEDAYAHHQYAEWYANTVRIPGSPTRRFHEATYGVGTSYEDLADLWSVGDFDPSALVGRLVRAGGRYVVPTSKHHDGFCLWDTATTPFNAARRGPRRDLLAGLAEATRAHGARFGLYYSGAHDWHVADHPPIESDTDLFRHRRSDEAFARYAAAQLRELVQRFRPDVLWNDIDWPDAGKGREDHGLARLLGEYLDAVPDGVVNDRWGVPFHGFLTREYTHVPDTLPTPWEATRGLGWSFGYNREEGPEYTITETGLVHLLVDVVAKNGNLLLNVGPRADGTLPQIQEERLQQLGSWLDVHGEAVFGTRPWRRPGDQVRGARLAYTRRGEDLYVHLLDPARTKVELPADVVVDPGARWLGAGPAEPAGDGRGVVVPEGLRDAVSAVLHLPGAAGPATTAVEAP